jgi:hypothetical protein
MHSNIFLMPSLLLSLNIAVKRTVMAQKYRDSFHDMSKASWKMQVLAQGFNEDDIVEFLKKVPVKLGKGKACVSLDAVLPKMCVQDIVRACEEFGRRA